MEMDQDIWQVFSTETLEIIDSLEESILAYENNNDAKTLHQAYQYCHTIKGSLSIIGFDKLETLVHQTEDLFHDCKEKPFVQVGHFVKLILFVIDLVRNSINIETDAFVDEDVKREFDELRSVDFYEGNQVKKGEAKMASESSARTNGSRLRIDSAKLDELLDLTGELLTVSDSFRQLNTEISNNRLDAKTNLLMGLIDQLSEKTLQMRMISLAPVMNRFRRTVRDISDGMGKEVDLVISGETTEVDKTIADEIVDPMIHLLKNCIDHGIGTPEERIAQGKDPRGSITIRAMHSSGSVIIEVEDDGDGLDYDKILEKARTYPDWNGSESEDDLSMLIFEPGFSTADQVSTISGRGIGMSAVKESIVNLRGNLSVSSRKGEGTRFTMRFPLSLALVEGLLIMMEGNYYIVPSDDVQECLSIDGMGVDQSLEVTSISWNESILPLINLKRMMKMEGEANQVVVVNSQNGNCGIICDSVVNIIQTVVKPLSPLLKNETWLQGSSVLGSGEPVLILNVSGLLDRFRL